jgi:hypothetical protein
LHGQDAFASDKGFEALLTRIPDARVVDSLETQWRFSSSSLFEKWKDFKAEIKYYAKGTSLSFVFRWLK